MSGRRAAIAATASSGVSSWHAPPQQTRSRETLERLLDAGERLLAERAFEGMRLRDVADAAGLTVGALYQRFPDKEAFYAALQQRFVARIRAEMGPRFAAEAWQDRDAHAVVARLVELIIDSFRAHRGLLRAFLLRRIDAPGSEPPLRRFGVQITRVVAGLLRARPGVRESQDLDERVAIGVQIVFSTAIHAVLNHPEPLQIDDPRMVPQLTEVLCGYLGIERAAAGRKERGRRRRPAARENVSRQASHPVRG